MLITAQPTTPNKAAGRRAPNPVRFPHVLSVCVSPEINGALEAVRDSFAALGYTSSDIVRLALFEWLSARAIRRPHNGQHHQEHVHAD